MATSGRRGSPSGPSSKINGWNWEPAPGIDDAENAVLAIASGEWDIPEFAEWLDRHLVEPG
jgi:hypothetical protein